MKIGDKVRFLSETGGGVVAGFKGNNIVLVEDQDGFEIPTPINDVVVVDTNDYNIAKVNTRDFDKGEAENKTVRKRELTAQKKEEEQADIERPVTFKAAPVERRGADSICLKLAFVPQDAGQLSTSEFDAYLINDSNYAIDYTYLSGENNSWKLRAHGTLAPNTKENLETFGYGMLEEIGRVIVQGMAYKTGKPFLIKPVFQVQTRIDKTKFYKENAFKENDFFDEPALVYDLVTDDKPVREVFTDAEELKRAMKQKAATPEPAKKDNAAIRTKNGIMEVDLHIKALLDNTDGMSNADMLNYQLDTFRKVMDENKKYTGRKIVFIHGKGDGVLRNALLKELRHTYKSCQYQDASFREYGFGATMVIIK